MDEYEATIGLEIHAELKTVTKMFCSSRNDPDASSANVHICPVCLAHPGTLPVINRDAVRQVLRVGLAIGARIADYTEFDRKNYFYPDLPKGYQLSQFEHPLVQGGELVGVEITRIHLEEDTASSIHSETTGGTLIDYNRAGVPLMELVTEPVIKSAEQAGIFARELQLLLRYLGASDANMEKGEMRVEANVSVAKRGVRSAAYVEIKNLNSFKAMERAVEFEIRRQTALIESGGSVEKQTLGWDDAKQATFPQRTKEGSADYRYFPDPDLPSLKLSEISELSVEGLRASLPVLPSERRRSYAAKRIKSDDIELYVRERRFGDFFDNVTSGMDEKSLLVASNYVANDLVKLIRDTDTPDTEISDEIKISAKNYQTFIDMIVSGTITSRAAKDILVLMVAQDIEPRQYAEEKGLIITLDMNLIGSVVSQVIADNPLVVADYKAGKESALEYLLGQSMRALKGSGSPETLRSLLKAQIGS